MAKRKVQPQNDDSDIDVSSTDSESEIEQSEAQASAQQAGGEEEEEETVNVDFDYFDLNPDVDFHATKTFLRQLFGDDATTFDISGLADLILQENSVGTTIKTDGKESDPFALLSVINLTEHAAKPAVRAVVDYVLKKTARDAEFHLILKKLLRAGAPSKTTASTAKALKVGLIVSERMINMPVEVVPPMYKMLVEEMQNAEDAHEKYEFDYFVVISKVYHLVTGLEQAEDQQQSKKKKKQPAAAAAAAPAAVQKDYFHYEDLVLEENATYKGVYDYTNVKQETDSRRVFTEYGIDPKLSVILLDRDNLAKSVPEMEAKFPPF